MKHIKLIVILFLSTVFVCPKASAQKTNTDSLFAVWYDKTNTVDTRVNSMVSIVKEFSLVNPDSAIVLTNLGLPLARKSNLIKPLINLLRSRGIAFYSQNQFEIAHHYLDTSIALSIKLNDTVGWAESLNSKGIAFKRERKYSKAINCFNSYLQISIACEYKEGHYNGLTNLAIIHAQMGNIKRALSLINMAESIGLETSKDQTGLSLLNTGMHYIIVQDYKNSIEYTHKSLKHFRKSNLVVHKAQCYNNLSYAYFELKDYKMSSVYLDSCIAIYKKINQPLKVAEAYSGYIEIAMAREDFASANEYLSAYLQIIEENKFENDNESALRTQAQLALHDGRFNEALKWINRAYLLAEKRLKKLDMYKACEILYEINLAKDDTRAALANQQLMLSLKDSLNAQDAVKALERMEFEKQWLQDSLQRAEAEALIKQEKKKVAEMKQRKNRIQYSLVVIVVLFLATIIAVATKFRISHRVASGLIFIFFILLFEFLLVVLDPWVDSISNGEVGWKIGINTAIALVLFGIHQVSENKLKKAIIKV